MLGRQFIASIMLAISASAATVNLTDFGAVGDKVNCIVATTSNSTSVTVTSTNLFTAGSIGSLLLVLTGGATTTTIYHQDYIGTITGVSAGTNLTVTPVLSNTLAGAFATVGKNNTQPIRDCLSSLAGTNDIVLVPAGNYLVMPDYMLTNGVGNDFYAVHIKRGGFTMQGQGSATITGNGYWQTHGGACVRGVPFALYAVTNNYPLVFDNLTFDGGVTNGQTAFQYFPADTNQGDGWDLTHDAVVDTGPPPMHANKTFSNCTFQHWRGEMVKSTYANVDGNITMTNCVFYDGNASGFNFSFTHRISNSRFDRLNIASEFFSGYATGPSYFENSVITNMLHNGLVLLGALTNHVEPLYTISGNNICTPGGISVFFNPLRNALVYGNTLYGPIYTGGAGYQGTDHNGDWTITNNTFLTTTQRITAPFVNTADQQAQLENVLFAWNTASNYQYLATGPGYNSNVRFSSNVCVSCLGGVNSAQSVGQYFYDDGSNSVLGFGVNGLAGVTNAISYSHGAPQYVVASVVGPLFAVTDSDALQIPAGALLVITNNGPNYVQFRESNTRPVYTRQSPNGAATRYRWVDGVWQDSNISYAGSATAGLIH